MGASAASRRPGLSCQVCVMGMEAGVRPAQPRCFPASGVCAGAARAPPPPPHVACPGPLLSSGARRLQPVSRSGCRRRRCPQRPGGPVPGPVPAASGSSAGKALTRVVATRLVTGTPACRTGSGETTPPAPPFPPAALRGGARPGASHAARPWHVSFSPTYRRLQFPPSLSPVPAALRPFASSVCPSPVS